VSTAQFFEDREVLRATASLSIRGLITYQDVNDKLNKRHPTLVYAVVSVYDNGCPEDYNEEEVGLFSTLEEANIVLGFERASDDGNDVTYRIDTKRLY